MSGKQVETVRCDLPALCMSASSHCSLCAQIPTGGVDVYWHERFGYSLCSTCPILKNQLVVVGPKDKCTPASWALMCIENCWKEDFGIQEQRASKPNKKIYFDANMQSLHEHKINNPGDLTYDWTVMQDHPPFWDACPEQCRPPPPPTGIAHWYFAAHAPPLQANMNMAMRNVLYRYEGEGEGDPPLQVFHEQPVFIAKRDINAGEWLTYSYPRHPRAWCFEAYCRGCFYPFELVIKENPMAISNEPDPMEPLCFLDQDMLDALPSAEEVDAVYSLGRLWYGTTA